MHEATCVNTCYYSYILHHHGPVIVGTKYLGHIFYSFFGFDVLFWGKNITYFYQAFLKTTRWNMLKMDHLSLRQQKLNPFLENEQNGGRNNKTSQAFKKNVPDVQISIFNRRTLQWCSTKAANNFFMKLGPCPIMLHH